MYQEAFIEQAIQCFLPDGPLNVPDRQLLQVRQRSHGMKFPDAPRMIASSRQ
jgi:hypothetical protein